MNQPERVWTRPGSRLDPCRLELELDTSAAGWGESISGRLVLQGRLRWPVPRLVEIALVTGSGAPIGERRYRWERVALELGEMRTFEFRLVIPAGTPPDPLVVSATVSAPLEAPMLALAPVTVLLPARYRRLVEILEQVSGVPVAGFYSTGGGDGFGATFTPDEASRDVFDGLRLEMFGSGSSIYGHLEIDPQEQSLADVLKAAAGLDRRRLPFRFPRNDPEEARRFFEQCLRPYLDAVRQLPIPAGKPQSPARTLPRPSSAPGGDDT
jgi:hypothetical protein